MNESENKLKVILADNRVVLREGMHCVLESEGDIEVVAETTSSAQIPDLLNSYPADAVVMNAADAEGVLAQLREAFPATRVVLVGSGVEDRPSLGPEAYLSRDMEPEELVRAVRGVGPVAGLAESKEALRNYLYSLIDAL
ncbi:MAG TPA: response regulator transcription factor [Dehalococcoidia bacterium]|jgi:DNA-binding NarL/FixJ family response regulator|nr:response regulator transcription factor [Dehalococcoidia bacterium]